MFYRGVSLNTLIECLQNAVANGRVDVAREFATFIAHNFNRKG